MKQLDQDSLLLHVNFVLGDGSSLSFPFKLHRTNTKLTLGRLFWLRTDGLLASGFLLVFSIEDWVLSNLCGSSSRDLHSSRTYFHWSHSQGSLECK